VKGADSITKEEVMPLSGLTDAELDVVCGGIFDVNTLVALNTNVNIAVPVVAANIFAGSSGPLANVAQGLNGANLSGAAFSFG
jgi:hypothetical protein